MNRPMSRDTGNAETGTLLQWHPFREWNDLLQGNNCILGGCPERAIGLSAIAPDAPTDPFLRHSVPNRINSARTIAVWYDTRIRNTYAKRILAFLDVAGIDAGEGNANPNLACVGLRVFHLTDDEYMSRCALSFIPSGFHSLEFLTSSGARYDFVLQTGRSLAC
jgi:hypothetical protein